MQRIMTKLIISDPIKLVVRQGLCIGLCIVSCSSSLILAADQTGDYQVGLSVSTPKLWRELGFKNTIDKSKGPDIAALGQLRKRLSNQKKPITSEEVETLANIIRPSKGDNPNAIVDYFFIAIEFRKAPEAELLIEPIRGRFRDLRDRVKKEPEFKVVRLALLEMLTTLKDKGELNEALEMYAAETEDDLKRWVLESIRRMGYELPFEEEKPKPKGAPTKP